MRAAFTVTCPSTPRPLTPVAHAQALSWKMARPEPSRGELPEATGEAEEAEEAEGGQATSSKKTEDLLAMVKRLQKEGSLEPQIEDLITRINELQQAKKRSSEALGEAQALQEALLRELDALNGERAHLEEVLSKKQEALMILQQHGQERETEAQRPGVAEQPEDPTGPRKGLWECHALAQRLARDIRALQRSREQLQAEGSRVRARLQEAERRLRSAAPGSSGSEAELELPDTEP